MNVKLGKLEPKQDSRTFRLASYIPSALPPPPSVLDLSNELITYPMYANDRLSDCTVAAAAHMIQLWSHMIGHPTTPQEADIISMYTMISGGVDRGAYMLDALKYWKNVGLGNNKIMAFASLYPSMHDLIKYSIYWFNCIYVGLWLPRSAIEQTGSDKIWDIPEGQNIYDEDYYPGSWGGHSVNGVGYIDDEYLYVVTWGQIQKMTWRFWDAYADEAYAIIPSEYQGGAPDILYQNLLSDLQLLSRQIG